MAPAGGRHPDVQFFFGGYYASCGDGEIPTPEEQNKKEKREIS